VDAHQREVKHFLDWISQRAGNSGPFNAQKQRTRSTAATKRAGQEDVDADSLFVNFSILSDCT
jgi:hypothetical protein